MAAHHHSSPCSSLLSVTSALAPFTAIGCFIVALLAVHFEQERAIFLSLTSVGYVLSLYGLFGLVATAEWNKNRKSHEKDAKFLMKCTFCCMMSILFISCVVFSNDKYMQGLLTFCMIFATVCYVAFIWYIDNQFEKKCLAQLKFKSPIISVINKEFVDDKRPLVVKDDRDVFNI